MTYEIDVQDFVREYSDKYSQKTLSDRLGVPPTTLHNGLQRTGGFAPKTHSKIVQKLEEFATELHAQGQLLELDSVPIPLRRQFLQALTGEAPAAQSADSENEAEEEDAPTGAVPPAARGTRDAANGGDSGQTGIPSPDKSSESSDSASIVVPDGASVLDPALWREGPPMNAASYYDSRLVEEDLRRVFEVSMTAPGTGQNSDDKLRGWTGPFPPDGVAEAKPTSLCKEILRLIDEWWQYDSALKVAQEAGSGDGDHVYLYALLRRYECELLLVADYYMTQPGRELALDDFGRQREVQRLKSEIQRLTTAVRAFEDRSSEGLSGLLGRVRNIFAKGRAERPEQGEPSS